MKKSISCLLVLLLVLCLAGCSAADSDRETETVQAEDIAATDSDMFTDRDYETDYDTESCIHIVLSDSGSTADSNSVQISDSAVTITAAGDYLVSGSLSDGMLVVDAEDEKVHIILNGVSINSESCAALYVLDADKVFVTLAEDSENTLSNGGSFTAIDDNNIDGAVFSKQDLTFNGSGTLTVTSSAGHGIVCKDDLVFTGGTYIVSASSHALDANDSIRITGETSLILTAGKDGVHAENNDDSSLGFVYISNGTFDIEAEGDGISAGSYMQLADGDFTITAGGGSENGEQESSDQWGSFTDGSDRGMGGMGGGMGQNNGMGGMEENNAMDGNGPGGVSNTFSSSTDAEITLLSSFTSSSDSGDSEEDSAEDSDSSTSMKGMKAESALLITGGTYSINSADDAVHSNSSITVNGGTFDIATGDDGFHADESLTVTDGTINITESYEGLEALNLTISGGDITIVSSDDGLNAAGGSDMSGTEGGRDGMFGGGFGGDGSASNGVLEISGGNIKITASGDGIDSNGTFTMSGGTVVVEGPTQGDTSTLDYDSTATITGGTFIGTGASSMAESFSSAEQGVIFMNAGNQQANTQVTVSDSDGNTILSFTPSLSFQIVLVSSEELVSGSAYTVTIGSTETTVTAS